ncbi:Uncharacterized protein HA466_0033280 [Hirschfeldia incana]|nr:Uncharacterized protein HA466_0033280 [Hirschfeldia incana]
MLKRHYTNAILHRIIPRFVSQTLMSSASSDPFLLRSSSLHTRSIGNRLGLGGFIPIGFHNDRTGCKGGKQNGLITLRSCFDSSHNKARALALHRHGPSEERCGGTTDLADGRGVGKTTRSQGNNDKIVVAVDIDEVLGNFVSALNKFIADRYLSNHSVSEYHVYEFFKIWNCSRNEADIRVHEFFKTSYFKKGIHPLPGAHKTLHKLSRYCELSVVTSRQNAIKDHTLEWLDMHFPGLFKQIHFGNHFALQGESKPKSEICRGID